MKHVTPSSLRPFTDLPSEKRLKQRLDELSQYVDASVENNRDQLFNMLSQQDQTTMKRITTDATLSQFYLKLKRLDARTLYQPDPRSLSLILTRMLGHKVDMPGMSQWRMFTERVH